MDASAIERVDLELRLNDEEIADEVEALLTEQGATITDRSTSLGVLPMLFPITIAAIAGVSAIAILFTYIHDKYRCQLLIDARGKKIRQDINCRIRDGRIIVLAKEGETVEIYDTPRPIDLTEITKAAVTGAAEAVKAAAEAAGAKAVVGDSSS